MGSILAVVIAFFFTAFSAEASSKTAPVRTIFDLPLEDVLRIQVKVSESANGFDRSSSLSFMRESSLRLQGAESLSDALSLIPDLQVTSPHDGEFATSAIVKSGRASRIGILFGSTHKIHALNSWRKLSREEVSLDQVERIEVVRGAATALFAPKRFDIVVVVVMKDGSALVEGGSKP